MLRTFPFAVTILAACFAADVAPLSLAQNVAYVYVASATEITGYAAAANGTLTPIAGLPIDAAVSHLSVTSKFVYGPGTDNQNIYAYAIGAGGALTPGPVTYAQQYNTNGCAATLGPTQIGYSSQYLYDLVPGIDCAPGDTGTQVYRINANGTLSHYAGWYTQIQHAGPPTPIRLLGNDQYAFLTGCSHNGSTYTPVTKIYNPGGSVFPGGLYPTGTYNGAPTPSGPQDFYCPAMLAADPTNHLAFAYRKFYPSIGKLATPYFLASYSVDAQGNLTTTSNYANMPSAAIGTLSAMTISPDGKLLAVAGTYGFEIFHFNGASPITKIGSLIASDPVVQLAWDKAGHLYVLTASSLYVYNRTTTGVQQAAGSPYAVSGSALFSLIALSLTH